MEAVQRKKMTVVSEKQAHHCSKSETRPSKRTILDWESNSVRKCSHHRPMNNVLLPFTVANCKQCVCVGGSLVGWVMLCISPNSISISTFTPALTAYLVHDDRKSIYGILQDGRGIGAFGLFLAHYFKKWSSSAWLHCLFDRSWFMNNFINSGHL